MITQIEFERSRTGADCYVLSMTVDGKHGVVHFFAGMTLDSLIKECIQTHKTSRSKNGPTMEQIVREAYEIGARTDFTMAEMDRRGMSYRAFQEAGSLFDRPKDQAAVDRFNSRWRMHCVRQAFRDVKLPEGTTYDEILQAVREVFVVEKVMDS